MRASLYPAERRRLRALLAEAWRHERRMRAIERQVSALLRLGRAAEVEREAVFDAVWNQSGTSVQRLKRLLHDLER